jgi:hypothetical protein
MNKERPCAACGGRNRIIGRNAPTVLHLQCRDCGRTTMVREAETPIKVTQVARDVRASDK